MAALGNLACADVAGCFAQVRDAIQVKPYHCMVAAYSQFRHNEIDISHEYSKTPIYRAPIYRVPHKYTKEPGSRRNYFSNGYR